MDRRTAHLKARVEAFNRAGEAANELFPQLLNIFKQFAGQKVTKVSGSLTKKVEEQLPPTNWPDKFPAPTVMYYRNTSEYQLTFTVKTCAPIIGYESCTYASLTIGICDIENGVVKDGSWGDPPNYRTDYTADEIANLRKVHEQKKQEADDARAALSPFGEMDN